MKEQLLSNDRQLGPRGWKAGRISAHIPYTGRHERIAPVFCVLTLVIDSALAHVRRQEVIEDCCDGYVIARRARGRRPCFPTVRQFMATSVNARPPSRKETREHCVDSVATDEEDEQGEEGCKLQADKAEGRTARGDTLLTACSWLTALRLAPRWAVVVAPAPRILLASLSPAPAQPHRSLAALVRADYPFHCPLSSWYGMLLGVRHDVNASPERTLCHLLFATLPG